MNTILIYVHDPMCSWCWGFESVRQQLFSRLPKALQVQRLVGGLAPDSMQPMPIEMQNFLQQTWRKIAIRIPGTNFNHAFWEECSPRRSTYPSNRAVIAARLQGEHFDQIMTYKIQYAYYQQAKNPSDNTTLIQLAEEMELDLERFIMDLNSESLQQMLLEEIKLCRRLGMNSFPSLTLRKGEDLKQIRLDYNNADSMLKQISDYSLAENSSHLII